MKKIILFLFIVSGTIVKAQTCGLMLFTETGEKFFLYTNGTLRNQIATNEVKIVGLPSDIVKVKIQFENKEIPTIEKTMFLRMGVIEHHRIYERNGLWKTIFDNDEQIPTAYINVQQVVVINNTVVNTGTIISSPAPNNTYNQQGTYQSSTTYNSGSSCIDPISDKSFYDFMLHFNTLKFDSDRLKESKDAVSRECFTSTQIKMVLEKFSFETSRLEFAKYAYDYCYDKGAYSTVKQAFTYSTSGDELDEYIEGK